MVRIGTSLYFLRHFFMILFVNSPFISCTGFKGSDISRSVGVVVRSEEGSFDGFSLTESDPDPSK